MPSPEPPTGTVTFLFTDLEGSTRLWQAFPEAMPAAYARHDAILREVVTRHGGVVYKVIGDGAQVAFPTASAALAAAVAAQERLNAEEWGILGLTEPLRARMALHSGAAEPQADGDYRSPILNRLGRLLAAGHGGQILLTPPTAELVRRALPTGTELRDLGEHRLKDLEPERVFQVVGSGLATDFPPLAGGTRRSQNLPTPPTALVGREREAAELAALMRRPDVRLVTCTGPGGTGKTRLSIEVATHLLDEFGDGAYFVALAPIADPALFASTVAREVGVQEEAGRPMMESLKDSLRDRELLLVLDNFEQVTDAAPLVADLLGACPRLKALVTSREALHLRAEREFPVPPLRLPDPRRPPPGDQIGQYEAVRLFIERAVAVNPAFAVTNANAPAVAEICHRLDGLPLAIELAAARCKLLAPEAMLARLERRLTLLTGGARDLPARQQTLRGAIAWSHDLLTTDEQALFRRLGVFVGGCSVEAAEAVCNPDGELALFDVLGSLVDKSLLLPQGGPEGEPRFGMLETIREFALEQLETSGEAEPTRRAHAAHFLKWTDETAAGTWGAEQARWLARQERELDNLRAALAWAIDRRATQTALELGILLEKLWDVRGYLSEGRRWLERGLALPLEGVRPGTHAQALSNAGDLAQALGDLEGARALQERALAIIREVDTEGGRRGTAHVLNRLGIVVFLQGDHDRSDALQQEALARFRDIDDTSAVATVLNNLGVTAEERGDLARARALYEEALILQREAGDLQSIAIYLGNLGGIATVQGDYGRAETLLEEGLVLYRELGDRWNVAHALGGLGQIALDRGDPARAFALYEECLVLARGAGAKSEVMRSLVGLGTAALRLGDPTRATELIEEGLALAKEVGEKRLEKTALVALGQALRGRGDDTAAIARYGEGLRLAQTIDAKASISSGLEGLGAVVVAGGLAEAAARQFGAAAALRESLGTPIPPAEREAYERDLATARSVLGEAVFAAAWAAGRHHSLEEAVAEASALADNLVGPGTGART